MRLTTQSSSQLQTIFGGGYVQEQHRDETLWNLSCGKAESLEEQMIWADANLAPATRAAWLKGLIELFEDKAWAHELVSSAKLKLTAIENSRD